MTQTISRLYDSPQRAQKVAHELRTNRFVKFSEVHVVSGHGPKGAATADAIVAELMNAFILKARAKVHAQDILAGGTLVTVHAPFGTGNTAIEILERHGPIPSSLDDAADALPAWDDAAPLSSALFLPVLLPDSATFSRFWNVPAITKGGATTSSALGVGELSDNSRPFTGTFGGSLLSDKATPLSSLLGLPVLSKSKR